jgi:hypothetical protein
MSWTTVKKSCEMSGGSVVAALTPIIPAPRYWLDEMLSPQVVTSRANVTR